MVLKDMLLAAGILKGLKVMRVDDSLALPSPKAYPPHSGTLLRACSRHPSTQFPPQQLGTKAGKLTHRHK
jgi:hypothetical protein